MENETPEAVAAFNERFLAKNGSVSEVPKEARVRTEKLAKPVARKSNEFEADTEYEMHELALIFPRMKDEEFSALKESIKENGLRDAISLFEGQVLDGRHRYLACKEVGVKPRFTNLPLDTDIVAYVVDKNENRRQLSSHQRTLLGGRLAQYSKVGNSTGNNQHGSRNCAKLHNSSNRTDASEKFEISERNVSKAVKALNFGNEKLIELLDAETATINESDNFISKAQELESTEEEIQEALDLRASGGEKKKLPNLLVSIRNRNKIEENRAKTLDIQHLVTCADIRDLDIEPESLDAIVTDPPYPREFLDTFTYLRDFAVKTLKPGGRLIVMSGQAHLPEVFSRLEHEELKWRWMGIYLTPRSGGRAAQVYSGARIIESHGKPLLMYSKSGAQMTPHQARNDVVESPGLESSHDYHKWGQSIEGMKYLLQYFVEPGSNIYDPYCGSGTTLLAAQALGMSYAGSDIEQESVDTALVRLVENG